MKTIAIMILIGVVWFLSAATHELDIYNACKNKGNSSAAMWFNKIECTTDD